MCGRHYHLIVPAAAATVVTMVTEHGQLTVNKEYCYFMS